MGENLLFVYGSLKRGGKLSDYLAGAKYCCDGVAENFGLINLGNFPGMVPLATLGDDYAKGEIYAVSNVQLYFIDRAEGSMYTRIKIQVKTDNGAHWCWAYLFNHLDIDDFIRGGDWRA